MGKIKLFLESEKRKDILIVIIVILVGLASFELGRLSNNDVNSGIKIEHANQAANAISSMPQIAQNASNSGLLTQSQDLGSGKYFASKLGHRYYSAGCSAGKNIKQENRIYFSTTALAESAGYTLSSACQ